MSTLDDIIRSRPDLKSELIGLSELFMRLHGQQVPFQQQTDERLESLTDEERFKTMRLQEVLAQHATIQLKKSPSEAVAGTGSGRSPISVTELGLQTAFAHKGGFSLREMLEAAGLEIDGES